MVRPDCRITRIICRRRAFSIAPTNPSFNIGTSGPHPARNYVGFINERDYRSPTASSSNSRGQRAGGPRPTYLPQSGQRAFSLFDRFMADTSTFQIRFFLGRALEHPTDTRRDYGDGRRYSAAYDNITTLRPPQCRGFFLAIRPSSRWCRFLCDRRHGGRDLGRGFAATSEP